MCFEPMHREKHDDVFFDFVVLTSSKAIREKRLSPETAILTIFDLWRLICWPVVNLSEHFIEKGVQELSITIPCALLAIIVPGTVARFLYVKYKNIYRTLTFDNLRWP